MTPGAGFTLLLLISTGADAVVAGLVLFAPWKRSGANGQVPSITLGRVLMTTAVTGTLFVAKLPVLQLLGVGLFGVIHLAYLDTFILLPLAGVGVLLAGRRRQSDSPLRRATGTVRALAWTCIALAPVGVYSTYIEPFRLQLETARVPVPVERDGCGTLRIGVLADIQTAHVTDYERSAVRWMMGLAPDVILLPGDLFQGTPEAFERELPALRELISGLSAPGGVYFVPGNVDRREAIKYVLRGTQDKLLVNEVIQVTVGDRRLTLGGLELAVNSSEARRTIRQLETAPGHGDIRILMAHRPDAALLLEPDSRIDLVVAGHTHGGQIRLPFFGPPFTASRVPRPVAAGGHHDLGGRRVYVSRGVGYERGQAPRIRFLVPPEISLLTLGDP